jgi:uncharacterized protein
VKFVILLLAVLLLLWMLFGRSRRGDRADRPPRGTPPAAQAEGMVACAHCGVHLPRSEAVLAGALSYCSAAHREAGPRTGGP